MGFSAASVAVLEYDFTAFPQDGDASLRCTGKGRIPEPSKAQIEAFFNEIGSFVQMPGSAEDDDGQVEARIYEHLSAVCSGKPSVDELKLLPPRILFEFAKYLFENLVPKG
jgi:hypothetical protein